MNKQDEQQQRNHATMDFYKSADDLAEQIAAELKRIDAEERRKLEESYQGRALKAGVNE